MKQIFLILFCILCLSGCTLENNDTSNVFKGCLESNSKIGTTTSNIINGGYVTYNQEYIYYISGEYDNGEVGGFLYKENRKTKERKLVLKEYVKNLLLVDDTLYYQTIKSSNRENIYKIYSMNTKEEKPMLITTFEKSKGAADLSYYNGKLYYRTSGKDAKIVEFDLNTKEEQELISTPTIFMNVVGNCIYYIGSIDNEYAVIYFQANTPEKQNKINNTNTAYNLKVDNGWLYFNANNSFDNLYRISVDGTHLESIYDQKIGGYNIASDGIYFIDNSNSVGGNIYHMKTNGAEKRKIATGRFSHLNIVDQYIYYINMKDKQHYRMKKDGTDIEKL